MQRTAVTKATVRIHFKQTVEDKVIQMNQLDATMIY